VERTAMSTREVKRWVVMRRIRDGELSRHEAATVLGVSYRQIKRLVRQFQRRGQKGLVHGNVGGGRIGRIRRRCIAK
jgi:transposase